MGDVPPPSPPPPPPPPAKPGFFGRLWNNVKAGASWVWNKVKAGASWVWGKISALLSWICSWSIIFAIVIMIVGIVLVYFTLVVPGVIVFVIGIIALFCRWV